MATVSVVFGVKHEELPFLKRANQSEAITSSGTSQASSNTGTIKDDCVEVATSGGAIWVTVDGSTAAAGNQFLLPDGTTRHFVAGFGTQVRVIDA
jgi:hypothetical protein